MLRVTSGWRFSESGSVALFGFGTARYSRQITNDFRYSWPGRCSENGPTFNRFEGQSWLDWRWVGSAIAEGLVGDLSLNYPRRGSYRLGYREVFVPTHSSRTEGRWDADWCPTPSRDESRFSLEKDDPYQESFGSSDDVRGGGMQGSIIAGSFTRPWDPDPERPVSGTETVTWQLTYRGPCKDRYCRRSPSCTGPGSRSVGAVIATHRSGMEARGADDPPVPANGSGLDVYVERDNSDEATAAHVGLTNKQGMYVAYDGNCAKAAFDGLRTRTDEKLFVGGRQPGLRTFDRKGAHGPGATDQRQHDIHWNCRKLAQTIAYIKETIDSGLPLYVGVNEGGAGQAQRAPPATGPINEGVTDHFLLVVGYRIERKANGWVVTGLDAVDNAAGRTLVGRYPHFNVAACSARKRATCANPEDAVEHEYQLTQVRVYAKDVARLRGLEAWWPPPG